MILSENKLKMFNQNHPSWLLPHLYENKNLLEFNRQQLQDLKLRLRRFSDPNPEISIVIPAYNEENNIHRTLSSLASNTTSAKVEIIVINNNSKDNTQKILDILQVKSHFQPLQGIAFARQKGLELALGKYHLCADADTFYPPNWIDLMVEPMIKEANVVGVYGRYSFLHQNGQNRFSYFLYEKLTGILFRLRRNRREHINVLGFNMGFITEIGREKNGFSVKEVRKFDNSKDSNNYTEISEDGNMAVHLLTVGNLKMITDRKARVFTSSRKILQDGGITRAFFNRFKKHFRSVLTNFATPKKILLERDRSSVNKF